MHINQDIDIVHYIKSDVFSIVSEIFVCLGHIFSSRYSSLADVSVMPVGHKALHMHFQMDAEAHKNVAEVK